MSKPQETLPQISSLHTACKLCIFAEYEDDLQVGCQAEMIGKYTEAGAEIIEVYDDEKKFYVLNNRRCMMQRLPLWAAEVPENERIERARKEGQIKYQVVISCKNGDYGSLANTVYSLIDQTVPPSHITVLSPDSAEQMGALYLLQDCGIPWKLSHTLEEASTMRWVDLLLKSCSFPFIGIFNDGVDVPKDTFEKIDNYINDDLKSFLVLTPNSNNDGLIIPFSIYNDFKATNFTQTFLEYVEDNNCLTKPKTEIVPDFPK